MRDLIDRQAAIDAIYHHFPDKTREECAMVLHEVPSAQPEPKWIPFKTRPLTEEEKEEYPDWEFILDCRLPENGQHILVNIKHKGHEAVQYDEYCDDDGCYLDSGYEIATEATAWMPLPEPYKEDNCETD